MHRPNIRLEDAYEQNDVSEISNSTHQARKNTHLRRIYEETGTEPPHLGKPAVGAIHSINRPPQVAMWEEQQIVERFHKWRTKVEEFMLLAG
jgi:hypothetical protein